MFKEIVSVVHFGNKYQRSDGDWYDSLTNLKAPLVLSHALDSKFPPRKKLSLVKHPKIRLDEPFRRNWMNISGGLSGLGRKR